MQKRLFVYTSYMMYNMRVFDFISNGGKNLITDYIDSLDDITKETIYYARELIANYGMNGLESLNCRKLYKKVYEIKIRNKRLDYYVKDDCIYFIHIFRKQKNKTEKKDIDTIKRRYNNLLKGD